MLNFRKADSKDIQLYYTWANDSVVRSLSFNSDAIPFEQHETWFNKKLNDQNCLMLVYSNEADEAIGQVRIDYHDTTGAIIGISIDERFRGLSYGTEMLMLACSLYQKEYQNIDVNAYIKKENVKSKRIFEKTGFVYIDDIEYLGHNSFHYIKYANRETPNIEG